MQIGDFYTNGLLGAPISCGFPEACMDVWHAEGQFCVSNALSVSGSVLTVALLDP